MKRKNCFKDRTVRQIRKTVDELKEFDAFLYSTIKPDSLGNLQVTTVIDSPCKHSEHITSYNCQTRSGDEARTFRAICDECGMDLRRNE